MTERKPIGVSWESWIDAQVRRGMEEGAFDNLPGKNNPLEMNDLGDPDWWIKAKLRREGVSHLPTTLQLRADAEVVRSRVQNAPTESSLRAVVHELNERIRRANRLGADGPPNTLMPLDEESLVQQWRELHSIAE